MSLSWLKDGLLPYHTFAFYLAGVKSCIFDMPMTPQQLHGELTLIFDRDPVGKNIVKLPRVGIRRLVFRLYSYLYALGYFSNHLVKNINFF
jgi:hypothetical protein